MSRRALVIPAAGTGSRLGQSLPKLLVPVAGRPMIDWLHALYEPVADEIVLVVSPGAEPLVRRHIASWRAPVRCVLQPAPTGMLDAIAIGAAAVSPESGDVWITWCDQIAVHPATVARLARERAAHPAAACILPTVRRIGPYIHFDRDERGRITGVRQRREGDAMPGEGESDMGLFALAPAACRALPDYVRVAPSGAVTGERNFLPMIPWLAAAGGEVVTFPAVEAIEAVGVNTPEELDLVAGWLARRAGADA
jgi:CTP:molybdopterin cytidylyltransferase MocA